MSIPIVIDCDPGIDDALAILLALSSEKFDVKAITTVAGNQTVEKTTENALKIVDFVGKEIKVAAGAAKPLRKGLQTAEYVHGASGLGDAVLPQPYSKADFKNAVDTISEIAGDGVDKLQIIALGPLTNIALLLSGYPDVKSKIARITLMGGSCYLGNITPAAEFNIHTDPEAAGIVFNSGCPITMIGLDATHQAVLYENEIADIITIPSKVSKFTGELLYSSLKAGKRFGNEGSIMHDVLAVAAVINPDLIKTKKYRVDIETKGEFTSGKTVVDLYDVGKREPNTEVALEVNREGFIKMVKEMMGKYAI